LTKRFIYISCMALLFLFPGQIYAMTVVIDPGHGGHDPGAIGIHGLKEKDINLDIAKKLEQQLKSMGYDTIMTREADIFLSLQERVAFANQSGGDIFVSIHANAHSNSNAKGTLVLYYDDAYPNASYPASSTMRLLTAENKALAQSIQDHIIGQVHTVDRGIVPSVVFVVRNGLMPSVLVETAFVSNEQDAKLLNMESFRANVAKGIAIGISQYQPPIFYDVHNHWAKESILSLEKLGIVKGNNGAFYPNQQMTRAEFIAMLDRLLSFDKLMDEMNDEHTITDEQIAETNEAIEPSESIETAEPINQIEATDEAQVEQYPDLSDKHWAYSTINKGVKLGIINGFDDGTIRPNAPISRAEMVVLFDKLALSDIPTSITDSFIDVAEQSWFASSVYKMKDLGYIHGITENSFVPSRKMSRAEGATIISRYLRSDTGHLAMNNLQNISVQ
jgi:N-acetylmuramoyl-L-alanine amidase